MIFQSSWYLDFLIMFYCPDLPTAMRHGKISKKAVTIGINHAPHLQQVCLQSAEVEAALDPAQLEKAPSFPCGAAHEHFYMPMHS